MIDVKVLRAIASSDPDGDRAEPTETMRRRFKAQTVKDFGQQAWDAYNGEPWANVPE
jgi:hypothetical protein